MDKKGFLEELRQALTGLPQHDIEERLGFYAEMIDDRMEEGMSEEDAVAHLGAVTDIATEIVGQTPLSTLVKEKVKQKRRLRTWEIVLLALGSPIWLVLLISFAAVLFSVYAAGWAVIVSLWAVGAALVGCSIGGVLALIGFCILGNAWAGLGFLGVGLFLDGLAIFWFFGCGKLTLGYAWLMKKTLRGMKLLFVGRRNET